MKPLKLTITAFGPYKDTEIIDFQELGEHRLFAISGKTGAGKTTIFDAICYALYGSGSGEDRQDTALLRSGFAHDDIYTAVELMFEMHGRVYQIIRQPGHMKEKNKTITGKKIELAEVKEGKLDYSIVEKQQTLEVDKKLQEIIGLTKDQFSQIVMLPQGEFRKLLTSDSTNKEVILRKIFKTDRFGVMTKKLDAKRKEAESDLQRAKQLKEHLLGQIDGVLPQRSSSLFTLIADKTENLHQLKQALDEEFIYYTKCIEDEQLQYEEAYSLHQKEQEYYRLAKTLNEQFDEQANRQQRLQMLLQEQDVYRAKEQEIVLAEQAERLVLLEQQCIDLRAELNVKEQAFQQAQVNHQQTEEQLQRAQEKYRVEEAKEPERQQILQQELQLLASLPKFEAYENNVQQLQIAEQYVETAKMAVVDNLTLLEKEQEQLQQFSQTMEGYEKQVEPYESYLEQLPKLREQVALVKQAEKYKSAVELAQQDVASSDIHYQESKKALLLLQQRWLTSQASILAEQLKEGEPCPVCGSMTHEKTHKEQLEVIELAQVETLRVKASSDERMYLEKAALLSSTQQLLQDTYQQLEAQHIKQEDQAQLIATLHKTEQEIASLKVVHHQLVDIRLKLKHQRDRIEQLRNKQMELEQYLAEHMKEWTRLQAVVEEQLKQMPANLPTLQQLKQQLTDVSKQKMDLQKTWQESQENLHVVKEATSNAKLTVEIAKQSFEELQLKMNEKRQQFSASMQEIGFDSYEEYAAAKRSAIQLEALRKVCSDYALQVHTLKIQITEGAMYLQGKEKQDLVMMKAKVEQLRTAYEEAFKRLQQMNGFAQACQGFIKKVEETARELQLLEQEAGRVKELYGLLNGQNSKKLSFERYIQINYLDQITDAANIRLYHLSNGQFELRRSDRLEKHAKQSGLGLDVYDAYTDQLRDVKTLSGGEKFNASLSLALGMADVIQSFQGNIHIETMFIDEGFGSLDEESLNKAIDTLIALQDSGRMIGVISHVPELKSAMPAVLHVEKTLNGHSQTHFEVK
ncbi:MULTISPECIES: SMC family ATPase [unclassified Lysinibacillus]|uniref:AAA family ATPase n=1 Tax=unclassified Lysinibacillus TaxID=2636778 RepID=UPI00088D2157|nr:MULTISPECIES: SMC family ATPase [unclassified Lysinibacillus]SCZ04703.1 exonuclease SbcC [Lysinibacillus sp. SG9]SDB50909.1 exonuclease SbcC [Lysinibacillus sp. TC-37]SFT14797.1 exonuclease SbcC [Lysinibacillus sp. SG55]